MLTQVQAKKRLLIKSSSKDMAIRSMTSYCLISVIMDMKSMCLWQCLNRFT